MKPYIEWTKEELVAEKARLEQEFAEVDISILAKIPRYYFHPKPKVDSASIVYIIHNYIKSCLQKVPNIGI